MAHFHKSTRPQWIKAIRCWMYAVYEMASDINHNFSGIYSMDRHVSVTRSGLTCAHWDSTVDRHGYSDDSLYADGSIIAAANYCCKPGGVLSWPWCYPEQGGIYEYCSFEHVVCRSGELFWRDGRITRTSHRRHGVSNTQSCIKQFFFQANNKESTKALHHWPFLDEATGPLWGESTGLFTWYRDRNVESVSMPWRHHAY